MKTAEIRKAFLNYFAQREHHIVPSSSLIPTHDPTLLFTNAGMVPFKDVFLGIDNAPDPRVVSIQKCVRAGGKHNDLENVGYTARHHTFFEMLGFFSFGDYFKHEAIQYAWDFLTNVLKLSPEKLWVTVYKEDLETAHIWLKDMKVSLQRFSYCGESDNFWSMGEVGPCGPCTEIFYDHGSTVPGNPPGQGDTSGDRYIEIWNLVFMQYNRDKKGKMHPLPRKSVDTGMGLERLAAVMQGVHSNYDTDVFQPLIKSILKLAPQAHAEMPAVKVIADHLRAMVFLVADGVMPTNEGRGYVLRRIIRRAIRHAHYLDIASPFLKKLLPRLIQVMQSTYPMLLEKAKEIEQILTQEEVQFKSTLATGLQWLKETIATLKYQVLPGEMAFKLYDTYGFPVDLTEELLNEQGIKVDHAGFEMCMEKQRAQSKIQTGFTSRSLPVCHTDASQFVGYDNTKCESHIQALGQGDEVRHSLKEGEKGWVVLDVTPFYAESGGQVGDTGILKQDHMVFEVQDTQKQGQIIIHDGQLKQGVLTKAMKVCAEIDEQRRQAIRLNHTATHLLHAALRQHLGQQLEQKGSLVEAQRARFDFAYPDTLTEIQCDEVEDLVNQHIRANDEVMTETMSMDQAKQSGALALFGEKYGETVRVLNIADFSKELCGGTHACRTGDIGYFKIIESYSIAHHVKRVEIVTGQTAVAWVQAQWMRLNQAATHFKVPPSQLEEKIQQCLKNQKEQEYKIKKLQQSLSNHTAQILMHQVENMPDMQVLIHEVQETDLSTLRQILDILRTQLQHHAIIVLYTIIGKQLHLVVGVGKRLLPHTPSAVTLAKILCDKTGGREEMAQGGGALPADFHARLATLKKAIQR